MGVGEGGALSLSRSLSPSEIHGLQCPDLGHCLHHRQLSCSLEAQELLEVLLRRHGGGCQAILVMFGGCWWEGELAVDLLEVHQ